MTGKTGGCAACLGLVLMSGCAMRGTPESGFGPESPAPTHPTPTVQSPYRVAPGYASSVSVPMPKAMRLRQTRIDAFDPQIQNWEIELDLLRIGAQSADADELLAAWMTGRPGAEGRTTTELGIARSIDGARSFSRVDVQSPLVSTAIPFDPTVEFDRRTQRAYLAVMGQTPPFVRQLWVASSSSVDSAHFAPGVIVPKVGNELPDKGWLAIGPAPGDSARSVVYLADRGGVRVSVDEGATWIGPVELQEQSNLLQPLVLADGTLVVSYLGHGGQALFTRSVDAGRSYSAPVAIHTYIGGISELTNPALPGGFRAPTTTMIATASNDRLYAVLHDVTRRDNTEADIDLLLFTSNDQGRTWSAGRNITADLPPFSDQFLPWLAVDRNGRLHVAYFDTARHTGTDASADALVDVWYASSGDQGQTWSRTRLTQEPIDSRGTRWSPTFNAASAQFLGDYFTLVASEHAAYVAHPVLESGVYGMTVSRIDFEAQAASPIRDPRGLSGLWYEPATSGQGFELNWLTGDRLALTFYGHHDNGSNLFLAGLRTGRFGYGESLEIPLTVVSGGRFNAFDPAAIRNNPWGRLILRFDSCASAFARLEGLDGTQELDLVRLAVAPDLPCD